ncbi:MgtC/SapB family protein [Brevibacillus formosus]|uniref:MgtC/SapB family protein n=1 Tax=Brevibacillus formosus TaxID=54913 RepID=UPI003D2533DB
MTGMEFLRAGAMIKFNGNVKGLTTAAGMWVATAIGLMFSAGMYVATNVAAVFSYLTLDFHRLFPRLFSVTKISHPTDESIGSDERPKHCDDHDFYHEDHD